MLFSSLHRPTCIYSAASLVIWLDNKDQYIAYKCNEFYNEAIVVCFWNACNWWSSKWEKERARSWYSFKTPCLLSVVCVTLVMIRRGRSLTFFHVCLVFYMSSLSKLIPFQQQISLKVYFFGKQIADLPSYQCTVQPRFPWFTM